MAWLLVPYRKWLVLLLLLLSAACSREAELPAAKHGEITIDVRHSDAIVSLRGEWAFYWNRLLSPADFQSSRQPKPDGYLTQPGAWTNFRIMGRPIGPYGQATLRLIIHPEAGAQDEALALPPIAKAYRLWVDGRLAATRGVIGNDPAQESGAPSTTFVKFKSNGRPIALVLQISNHSSHFPGMLGAITIGPDARIEQQRLAPMRRTLFFSGGLAMIAFSCMAVFAFRRNDRSQLYFGIFVLLWTVIILVQHGHVAWLVELLGRIGEPEELRAEYVLLYASIPFAYAFFQSLYPEDIPARVLKIVVAVAAPLALAAVLAPVLLLPDLAHVAYALIGLMVLFLAYKVNKAVLKHREGAVFVLTGFAFLAAAGVADMASEMGLIVSDRRFMPFGILAFALSQALHMSHRSVRALQKVENLSAELDAKNQALELKIAETEHLSHQIVRVSEEERRRISQDLHDGICQQLTAARLRFSVLSKQIQDTSVNKDEVIKLSSLLEEAVNRAYDMSLGLWPVDTGAAELSTSFEELCRRIARMENLRVTFHRALRNCELRSPEMNRQLYRIAQEALANVVKHAKATKVDVSLTCTPQAGIVLAVEDDGAGLSGRNNSADGAGLGLRIMEHRAALIGGTLKLESRPCGGAAISCVVPCSRGINCPIRKETPDA